MKPQHKPINNLPDDSDTSKIPPHSIEIENNVLGGIMIDNELLEVVMDKKLKAEHFYRAGNADIYNVMQDLRRRGETIDLVTLTEELKRNDLLERAGGPNGLTEMAVSFSSAESIGYSAERLLDLWARRKLIYYGSWVKEISFGNEETSDILSKAQSELYEIQNYLIRKKYIRINEGMIETMHWLDGVKETHTGITGVPSGYKHLDELTAGFQKGELIIIAGRPSHGKSALGFCIARNAAMKHRIPVGIFSIEMSNRELTIRMLAAETGMDIMKIKTAKLTEDDYELIHRHNSTLMGSPVIYDDTSPLGIAELRAKAKRMKAEEDIQMVIIDYIQIMDVEPGLRTRNQEQRHLEIGIITKNLKQLAKELDIPIIALSQLSRKIEERGGKDKRPMLSDLRESGSLEQDADVVIFVNRPELYMKKDDVDYARYDGMAEVIVGKQRNGPVGEIRLSFIKRCAKFENWAKNTEF